MPERKHYKKRPNFHVTAVQLNLTFNGFSYQKWGAEQTCKAGDWLVNNGGDVYTVDDDYFKEHYQETSPGQFEKTAPVWAEIAETDGAIPTLEGSTDYSAGDYLVYDRPSGGNAYAVKKRTFERMYEVIEEPEDLTAAQNDYLNKRLVEQIDWYDKGAKVNRINFLVLQTLTIIAAALVPVLSGVDPTKAGWVAGFLGDTKTLVAFLGGASAVIASILGLFKCQENWVKYRSACEDLRSHYVQYRVGVGIYEDRAMAFRFLVENCERIISAERGQWVQQNSSAQQEQN